MRDVGHAAELTRYDFLNARYDATPVVREAGSEEAAVALLTERLTQRLVEEGADPASIRTRVTEDVLGRVLTVEGSAP